MTTTSGKIVDIGHAAFACHDIEASLDFYEKLGLTESFRLNHDDGSLMLVYLHVAGDRFIELFPNGPDPANRPPQGSYRHLCLMTDDLSATVVSLRTQGVTIDVEPKQGLDLNMQAWIRDPDGNQIELMQIDPRSPQRAVAEGREPAPLEHLAVPAKR
jgi:lactoylglutathione lyase